MNTNVDRQLEKRLADLMAHAAEAGPGAIFAVLQILHSSYIAGRHDEFAKHCATFAQLEGAALSATSPQATASADAPPQYIN